VKRPRIASKLFRAARRVDNIEALASGDPTRLIRRGKNRVLGRVLAKAGFWRRLWR